MTDPTHTIIVNFNAGNWLGRSVGSAIEHSSGPVTVVDNASTDDSVINAQQQVGEHQRLHWVNNNTNVGFAAANNQVLANLEVDFAVLLNPDCQLYSDTLEKILNTFANNPKLGLASCQILNEDGSPQATSRRRFPTPWSGLVRLLKLNKLFPNNPRFADFDYGSARDTESNSVQSVEAISGAFMVVRKTAMQEVGLLDEAYFMHCEDLDWCKRFELSGWQVGYVADAKVMHAKGVSSASRPVKVLWWLHMGMARFFNKFYHDQYVWPYAHLG